MDDRAAAERASGRAVLAAARHLRRRLCDSAPVRSSSRDGARDRDTRATARQARSAADPGGGLARSPAPPAAAPSMDRPHLARALARASVSDLAVHGGAVDAGAVFRVRQPLGGGSDGRPDAVHARRAWRARRGAGPADVALHAVGIGGRAGHPDRHARPDTGADRDAVHVAVFVVSAWRRAPVATGDGADRVTTVLL